MKMQVPIIRDLPIDSGFGVKNLRTALNLASEPGLRVCLWGGFSEVASSTVEFSGKRAIQIYLQDIFAPETLGQADVATVEFTNGSNSPDAGPTFKTNFEVQLLLRSNDQRNWVSLLYDLIPDKKPGHRYSPILHSAHTARVDTNNDSYVMMVNFRPPYLKTESASQKMLVQLKTADGRLLTERDQQLPFNSTALFSFRNEFKSHGGYEDGCQINFKGGESQFAIFTLFFNQKSHALGIEHSLPPIYYCSDIYQPNSRVTFYKNALRRTKELS